MMNDIVVIIVVVAHCCMQRRNGQVCHGLDAYGWVVPQLRIVDPVRRAELKGGPVAQVLLELLLRGMQRI